jgi:hypothetical protein
MRSRTIGGHSVSRRAKRGPSELVTQVLTWFSQAATSGAILLLRFIADDTRVFRNNELGTSHLEGMCGIGSTARVRWGVGVKCGRRHCWLLLSTHY